LKLRVATCQFPVSANIDANAGYVRRQLRSARRRGAHVAHFCEGALSGYAGAHFASHAKLDWERLERRAREIAELAAARATGAAAGTSWPTTPPGTTSASSRSAACAAAR
jgi:predicted amidohydrolase